MVLEGGKTIEKAGVNFSHVMGQNLPPSASAVALNMQVAPFPRNRGVSGLSYTRKSLCSHPMQCFALLRSPPQWPRREDIWWFGGGFDLTPYYGFREDAIDWHRAAKNACDPYGDNLYPKFKSTCDNYFYLKHRQEPRGIGGVFFDDFAEGGFQNAFSLMQSIGDAYGSAYAPIVDKRKDIDFGEQEKNFQKYRRGRYVEFNLVYDRGTLFGLQSNGRTESILMSLPPEVSWTYDWKPQPGTPE
ncbi:UNVERIFIED_CONTAM: hypothetical protein GTU68_016026, partial [Idotea baltica]|nr:hypothetical protein [Idotea baltica]